MLYASIQTISINNFLFKISSLEYFLLEVFFGVILSIIKLILPRYESRRKIEDDICKKVADIRMSPWSEGQELNEAQAATSRAR